MSKIGHFEIIDGFTKTSCQKLQENFFDCLDNIFKTRASEEVNFTSAQNAYWLKSSQRTLNVHVKISY